MDILVILGILVVCVIGIVWVASTMTEKKPDLLDVVEQPPSDPIYIDHAKELPQAESAPAPTVKVAKKKKAAKKKSSSKK